MYIQSSNRNGVKGIDDLNDTENDYKPQEVVCHAEEVSPAHKESSILVDYNHVEIHYLKSSND